jgi:hypothetical protein
MRQDVKVTYFSDILGRFDKQAGKIYGVSVITEGQAKGHDLVVDSQTLMEIKNAAESCPDGRLKTKLNHRSGVEAVFGYLENFRVDGPKLVADLKMLKSHKDFEQTFEQIESLPNALGLSVAFVGKEQHGADGKKLARCREILSADLVPEPAANPTGMFEAKNGSEEHAVVDTEKIDNMSEPTNPAGADPKGAAGAPAKEPTLADVMNFLQEQVLPRIEATEQFQAAIQAELEAAANGDPDADPDAAPGARDPNNASATAIAGVDPKAEGGTRGGGAAGSPAQRAADAQGHPAGAPTNGQVAEPAGAELKALHGAIVELQRKFEDKENQEREVQFERAMTVIKDKTEAVIEYARGLEEENATLLEALRTGVKPTKQSPSEIFNGGEKPTDFQSRVKAYVDAGKTKTEAVMLARKDDPNSHTTWLESQGVVTHL